MLEQDNFYSLKNFNKPEAGKVLAEIELNSTHAIFKGHFPGSPVVPGVCLVQISKELLEKSLNRVTQLTQSSQVKFLAIVNPAVDAVLHVALEMKEQEGLLSMTSTISSGEKIFFKFKGTFKTTND